MPGLIPQLGAKPSFPATLAAFVFLVALAAFAGQTADAPPAGLAQRPSAPAGGAEYPADLAKALRSAVAAQGKDYEPRTAHRLPDGSPVFTNRLMLEDSPYLRQHAHNPVDWFPWGREAFERAAAENKLVFLSIGYSSCHWCHVMERESFDRLDIARIMNEHFVAIKVDRERRPDVDEIYLTAIRLTSGVAGYPTSSFLVPDGRPFYGATYFEPGPFRELLLEMADAWETQRDEILDGADNVARAVDEITTARGRGSEVDEEVVARTAGQIMEGFDPQFGGFSPAPKFPSEPQLLFLLDRAIRREEEHIVAALEKTLTAMAFGGIYDQVGGGFHRYSTDERWLVPHFEKMLYNQANLVRVYLKAYELTGHDLYSRIARQTLDFVLRELTSPDGTFYSAIDADSEEREGGFFVWTLNEIDSVLAPDDARLAIDLFGISEDGNFEGKNVLHVERSLDGLSSDYGLTPRAFLIRSDRIRQQLLEARERRARPLRDEKIITAWNGMMITALTDAARVLGRETYLEDARRAAEYLWARGRTRDGGLWRITLNGGSSVPAVLDDHAFMTEAMMALYDSTGDDKWLGRARELADGMLDLFWDDESGGFYMSRNGAGGTMILRPKSPYEGAIPSGNSAAVRALARLAAMTGQDRYRDRALGTIAAFSDAIAQRGLAFAYMMIGAQEVQSGPAGPSQFGARGVVRASGRLEVDQGSPRVVVDIAIRDGWHINANRTLQDALIPTTLTLADNARGWELESVDYPARRVVTLGFQQEPLAVYEGRIRLSGRLRSDDGGPILPARLSIQACSDQLCLRPEELYLEVPAAVGATND